MTIDATIGLRVRDRDWWSKQARSPTVESAPVRVLEPLPADETAAGNRSFPAADGWSIAIVDAGRACRCLRGRDRDG
jgi:hypothetical protein